MTPPSRQPDGPPHPIRPGYHHVPPGTGSFGMALFLAALGMLFGASMLVYIVFRLTADQGPPLGSLRLPAGLWASTALILASSYTIHRALQNVRHERQTRFRNALTITLLLAVGFLVVQTPSMTLLYREHETARLEYEAQREAYVAWERAERAQQPPGTVIGELDRTNAPNRPMLPLYGFLMFLILLHALHVLGGLVPLLVVTFKAHADRYDHESYAPVKYLAMYWHFLDVVWILMFVMFLVAA